VRYPAKPEPGDRVAVISPSAGLPAVFPAVYEQGLLRLREDFGLEPVEFPTTRAAAAPARDRARDVEAAFRDPSVTAVLATIGGDDLISVVPHIDPAVLRDNPKPFFGYSDNVNLLHLLYTQGVVAYHGGSVMVHLGRGGAMHPVTASSLRNALFSTGWATLEASPDYTDEPGDWGSPDFLDGPPRMFPAAGWEWSGPAAGGVEGRLWGGDLEVITWMLAAGRVGPSADFAGCVLLIETDEEMPSAIGVYRMLRNMGERGLLGVFRAILVGRAKCWDRDQPLGPADKVAFAAAQREAVSRALGEYAPSAVVVWDLDVGHTDPQQILPYGGQVRVDPVSRTVSVLL
jgi:muramoyltetrapeptide carboxypeptidase LdcA involved in peptidoglycan recycling